MDNVVVVAVAVAVVVAAVAVVVAGTLLGPLVARHFPHLFVDLSVCLSTTSIDGSSYSIEVYLWSCNTRCFVGRVVAHRFGSRLTASRLTHWRFTKQ
jgi:hypothetical protein